MINKYLKKQNILNLKHNKAYSYRLVRLV